MRPNKKPFCTDIQRGLVLSVRKPTENIMNNYEALSNPYAPQYEWDIDDSIQALLAAKEAQKAGLNELAQMYLQQASYSVKQAIAHSPKIDNQEAA